jgi:hypothetical protein
LVASIVFLSEERNEPEQEVELRGRDGVSWHDVQLENWQLEMESTMELLLISAALGLTGAVWASRVRFSRRFNAALDAYAELESVREARPRRRD